MDLDTKQPAEVQELLKHNIILTTVEKVLNWGRAYSLWPLTFGIACCAIEMMSTNNARYDFARFGSELFRPSPRQADLLIVPGSVNKKLKPLVERVYNQMADPKYVIAMGNCAISGGPYRDSYCVLPGVGDFLPVDVYIPGCPPRPEALIYGLLKLREKIIHPERAAR
ncbi:MAG: NADH-quinone oxidoreductase subunit B [Syntrophomonadaceae bacterium]|nr:NADH-quinone oxidoreductase subunit B [Syntrophomonadaceae bacterium]